MKRFVNLLIIFLIILTPVCVWAEETDKPESPEPLPLLSPVPPEKLIQPKKGLGLIEWGASIEEVEKVYGRGNLVPLETDKKGNNWITLTYRDKGLSFKFFNGQLAAVEILKPDYATSTGVRVGCDVGDLIREFGAKFTKDQSLIAEQDPSVNEYDLIFDNIVASVNGKIITKLTIRTKKKLRSYR